jgi:hypothetical protein
VDFCTKCRIKARAFIRKPANGKPGGVSPAVRLAEVITVGCVLCTPLGASTVAAGAQPAPPTLISIVHRADPVIRWPAREPAESGDHELPHNEGPEQIRDGLAPTYAVTAPSAQVLTVLPPGWPADTLGLPGHSVLPPYSRTPGPHAAATHLVTGPPPSTGPGAAPAGPRLASR